MLINSTLSFATLVSNVDNSKFEAPLRITVFVSFAVMFCDPAINFAVAAAPNINSAICPRVDPCFNFIEGLVASANFSSL